MLYECGRKVSRSRPFNGIWNWKRSPYLWIRYHDKRWKRGGSCCDAKNHTLHDFEVEYKKGDKAFTKAAKISESEAEKIALKKYNGKVVDREYSIENGNPAYEFDIYVAKKGHEYEVEVDAVTGEILEVEMELYDIGSED